MSHGQEILNPLPKKKEDRRKNEFYKGVKGNIVLWNGEKCVRISSPEKSFASHEKALYWSPKNELLPSQVSKNSGKKFIFDCAECGHEFKQMLNAIVSSGIWCPFCANKKLCESVDCEICYYKSFLGNEKSFYWSKKNILHPRDVFPNSRNKFIFDCEICGHEFLMRLNNIVQQDSWCPFCSSTELCDDENCKTCEEKSFFANEKSFSWSNKNILKPRNVFKSSVQKFIFECEICLHEFTTSPNSITNSETWCPFCAHKKLCENENCETCFFYSFASEDSSFYWSKKNLLQPRNVFKNSNENFFFDCDVCCHEFTASLSDIVQKNSGCPFCAHRQLCEDEKCTYCFKNSFLSSPEAKYWSSKNKRSPREVFLHSRKKYWFDCDCGAKFKKSLSHISWCPTCKNKGELKLFKWCVKNFPSCTIVSQYKTSWSFNLESNRHLLYDIYFEINSNKIIIELDGVQHFTAVKLFRNNPNEVRRVDVLKMCLALQNCHHVIRLLQTDVWADKNNWQEKLLRTLQNLPSIPTCIYLSDNIYTQHQQDLERFQNILGSDEDRQFDLPTVFSSDAYLNMLN
jgi:Probable Zinc-ribbon domain